MQKYHSILKERLKNTGRGENNFLPRKFAKEFLLELYTEEYYKSILNRPWNMRCINGVNKLKDITGKYLNIVNGERVTVGQPENYKKTIYCLYKEEIVRKL